MKISILLGKATNFLPWLLKRIRRRNRFRWMKKQMYLVDPAESKRSKYWKKCGVDTTGCFKVGYGVYFDAGNAEHIHIEDGVKAVWNKVILHKDGNYGNWQESNLKAIDPDAPEAKDHEKLWAEWKRIEDIRLFHERFPNDPIPSFIK